MMAVGTLNALIRIICDPYLRGKLYFFFCVKKQNIVEEKTMASLKKEEAELDKMAEDYNY